MRFRTLTLLAATAAAALAATATAGGPFFIRLGDVDGIGFGNGDGFLNFEGDPVNVDGIGVLGAGDFMADFNGDGLVMFFSGDDFDFRSPGEVGNTAAIANGFVNTGSTGSAFTDIALSQSFDATFGTPNDFPDPPSTDRNDCRFVFEFDAPADQVEACQPVFFNIIFGDIGGNTASRLDLTFADGSTLTEFIEPINPSIEDGLIRDAFLQLDFDDVFTLDGAVYRGFVEVDLVTLPNETDGDPYYGVDFVELSTEPILQCDGDINLDAVVDVQDLLILLANWGQGCPDPCVPECRADFDASGLVDVGDLLILLAAWGPCV